MIKEYKITDFPLSLKYFSPRSDFLDGCIISQSELICLWRKSECIRYLLLKTTNIYNLIVSLSQEFGRSFVGWFCPGFFMRLYSRYWLGLQSSQEWTPREDQLPRWLTHMAVGWRPVSFFTGLFECPHGMAADFSQSEWYKRRWWGRHTTFYVLISEATQSYCHFDHILSARSEPLNIVHSQRRGVSLHFLKGGTSKNLWIYFKTTQLTLADTIFV